MTKKMRKCVKYVKFAYKVLEYSKTMRIFAS